MLPLLNCQIRKMFDKADRDGDGKLTKEEWHRVLNNSGCDTSMSVQTYFHSAKAKVQSKLGKYFSFNPSTKHEE